MPTGLLADHQRLRVAAFQGTLPPDQQQQRQGSARGDGEEQEDCVIAQHRRLQLDLVFDDGQTVFGVRVDTAGRAGEAQSFAIGRDVLDQKRARRKFRRVANGELRTILGRPDPPEGGRPMGTS